MPGPPLDKLWPLLARSKERLACSYFECESTASRRTLVHWIIVLDEPLSPVDPDGHPVITLVYPEYPSVGLVRDFGRPIVQSLVPLFADELHNKCR